MNLLDITPWGPKPLRDRLDAIRNAINERTPVQGIGVDLDETAAGVQICISDNSGTQDPDELKNNTGGGNSGTVVNIYGQLNGQPATYHLLQSSPATPLT